MAANSIARSPRGKGIKRSWKPRYQREIKRLDSNEHAECRKDPAWEARHGIVDYVVCRLCCRLVKTPLLHRLGHLTRRHPNVSRVEYDRRYPGAPLQSIKDQAKHNGMRNRDAEILRRTLCESYLTPQEVRECRKDPSYEQKHGMVEIVVCRICGLKLRSALRGDRSGSHLRTHPWCKDYFAMYPNAPWRPQRVIDAAKKSGKRWRDTMASKLKAFAELEDKVDRLRSELYKAEEKLRVETARIELLKQGRPAFIRAEVQRSLSRFEEIFADPAVKYRPLSLLDAVQPPSLSAKEFASVRAAVIARARNRAVYAALHFVSEETGIEFETVSRYYRERA